MSLPASMADFVPCDRLLQKAYYALLSQHKNMIGLSQERWQHIGDTCDQAPGVTYWPYCMQEC